MSDMLTLDEIFKTSRRPFSSDERKFVADALAFATTAHEGQFRKSGETYLTHALAVT